LLIYFEISKKNNYLSRTEKRNSMKIECENCEGSGVTETDLRCKVFGMSECCGGCWEDEDCEECDGEGEHDLYYWNDDELSELYDSIVIEGLTASENRTKEINLIIEYIENRLS
jgi:hypothetical protein